jgi:hypothetical protein
VPAGTLKRSSTGKGTGQFSYFKGDATISEQTYSDIDANDIAIAISGRTNVWSAPYTNQPDIMKFDLSLGKYHRLPGEISKPMDWSWSSGSIFCGSAITPGRAYRTIIAITLKQRPSFLRYLSYPVDADPRGNLFRDILKVGNTYHAFYEKYINPQWQITKKISKDGTTWNSNYSSSLFDYGELNSVDEYGQADPSVVFDRPNDWKMWHDTLNGSSVWTGIALSTSADGEIWRKAGLILTKGNSIAWDGYFVHHPCVIKDGSTYFMYYVGSSTFSSRTWQIGLATSIDGATWRKYEDNPIITVGARGEFDSSFVRPSDPIIVNGIWYMFYWGNNGTISSTGLAISSDGYNWTKKGQWALGHYGNWDTNMQAPVPIMETSKARLWYAGSDVSNSKFMLGLALIDFVENPHY